MTHQNRIPALLLGVSLVVCAAGAAEAAGRRFWALEPYDVRVLLAVETRSVSGGELAEKIAAHLIERADAAIGPVWDLRVEPLSGPSKVAALRGYSDESLFLLADDDQRPSDKLIVITLREGLDGLTLSGVECDTLLRHIGREQTLASHTLRDAPESAFQLLLQVFSPVAVFEVDRSQHDAARLSFRGSRLPRRAGSPVWGEAGDVLLPVLRRTDREGNVVADGVQAAPWTYLLIAQPEDSASDDALLAKIYSHTKRPFGTRRRGRVEQYALVLRRTGGPTHVRLHVRNQPDVPLPGNLAYVQDEEGGATELLGSTDADGLILVEPSAAPIRMVFIKSGSQVVAKAPAPVGRVGRIDIPLPDERKRIEFEAKLGLLREELVDLIARRSILANRIRETIREGDKQQARVMLTELDGMPGRAQFQQRLNRLERQARVDDPVVQARIDRQFADTSIVVGAFLGAGEVNDLRRSLSAAE